MCENYVIDLSVFHAVIFDRLLINYDPRIITEVKNEPITCDSYYPNNHQNETMFSFRLRLIKGVSILTVTRFDIGTIITKFLGQLSTIVFIVGLTVVPIIYIKFEIHTLS